MTEQKAIEEFNLLKKTRIFIPRNDTLDIAIEALEKQIPVKIKQDIVNGKMARWCPNGCEITHITQYSPINYCPKCGQAIKWE